MGLEDLETLERLFKDSNEAARLLRFASEFHFCQFCDLHQRHSDEMHYSRLSSFVVKKFRLVHSSILEATGGLLDTPDNLDPKALLADKCKYISGLKEEPPEQTIKIAYVERLVMLQHAQ